MPRFFRAFSLSVILSLSGFAAVHDARADDSRVTIVDVSARASELDPALLRSLLATELHMPTVTPDDPRASGAVGTLTIDVDRATGDLSVTYLARDVPMTRHIPLPKDDAAARNAVVALGGNLARNEAHEIEATLRPPRPTPPAPSEPPPTITESGDADTDHLRATLDYYAREERHQRQVVSGSLIVLGSVGIVTAVYMSSQAPDGPVLLTSAISGGALLSGSLGLLVSTPLEDLASYGHQEGVTGRALERRWAYVAAREHARRRGSGIIGFVGAGVGFGVGALMLFDSKIEPDPKVRNGLGAAFFGLGALDALLGIYALSTEGPVERSFHAYQEATGHMPLTTASLLRHVTVAPTPGGAMGVFSTRF